MTSFGVRGIQHATRHNRIPPIKDFIGMYSYFNRDVILTIVTLYQNLRYSTKSSLKYRFHPFITNFLVIYKNFVGCHIITLFFSFRWNSFTTHTKNFFCHGNVALYREILMVYAFCRLSHCLEIPLKPLYVSFEQWGKGIEWKISCSTAEKWNEWPPEIPWQKAITARKFTFSFKEGKTVNPILGSFYAIEKQREREREKKGNNIKVHNRLLKF